MSVGELGAWAALYVFGAVLELGDGQPVPLAMLWPMKVTLLVVLCIGAIFVAANDAAEWLYGIRPQQLRDYAKGNAP